MSNKPLVLVTAPVGTRSGYGSHGRDIVRSLVDLDKYDVRVWPVRWGTTPQNALNDKDPNDIPIIKRLIATPNLERQPDIHIHIVVPNEFRPIGKYNIGITAGIETTAAPSSWVEGINRMDLVIVPSNFSKEMLENTKYTEHDKNTNKPVRELKVTTPIEVLFEGADTNIYKKTNEFSKDLNDELMKIDDKFCFLFTGHWLQGNLGHDRKDVGMLVKTFLETFKNKNKQPALILKTSTATFSIMDKNEMLKRIDNIRNTVSGKLPNIYLLHGDLTDDEMNGLYNHPKVKAHVSFTHGEGFGRPLLEASMSEKPVMASNWSGHLDFLNKSNSIRLSGGMINVDPSSLPEGIFIEGSKWFNANYQYASTVMKDVFKKYKNYTLNAKKLGKYNKSRFSLDAMTKEFGKMLDKNLPEFPKEIKLKLPTLKKRVS